MKTNAIEVEMLSSHLLCIDDRPELLKLRKGSLEQQGYEVETATNAITAIKAMAKHPAAAVLLDYKLEGVDAQALAYLIKQRHPHVPIVLLSAYSEMPESLLWLVDEYVMKSEPVDKLAEIINKVISAQKIRPYSGELQKRIAGAA